MVIVHLRSGKKLEVSNDYSSLEKFIFDTSIGNATQLIDNDDQCKQYLVRREAIDYVEYREEE